MVDTFKINKANEIYSKLQGIFWAKEKNEEYCQYDLCKKCQKAIEDLENKLDELNLTKEEQRQTGYEYVNYDIAERYEGLYR